MWVLDGASFGCYRCETFRQDTLTETAMATFAFEQDGEVRRTSLSFFRGENTNFHPTDTSFQRPTAIADYIIKGWAPAEKFVTKQTAIVAFGSCFASNISNYLHKRGYNVLNRGDNNAYVTKLGDGLVNTYAIRQQFEWAWENKAPEVAVWHGKQAEDYAQDEKVRLETKELFDTADFFIVTLGLSELWYDEPTGEVFWRAVPKDAFDPARHKFRAATHAETLANLHRIYELVRRYRPEAHILISISPIPLVATFRPVSCITADAVSKATIRSAVDEFLSVHGEADKVHYFPSFEVVKRIFRHQWTDDRRHVRADVLDFNMKLFEHFYCTPGIPFKDVQTAYDTSWELDLQRGEEARNRPAVSYEEQRAKRKQARIQARIEARQLEREKVIAARKAEREKIVANLAAAEAAEAARKPTLKGRARAWALKAGRVVIDLLALSGLTYWIGVASGFID